MYHQQFLRVRKEFKMKKCFSILLAGVLSVSMLCSITVFALEETVATTNTTTLSDAENTDPWYIDGDNDEPSPGAINLEEIDDITKLFPFTRAGVPDYCVMSVPVCKQATSYYCGPATVQQLIRLFGKDYDTTQDDIAKSIGTTSAGSSLKPMVDYIRDSGYAVYRILSKPSLDDLQRLIGTNISGLYTPPIGRIRFDKGGNWSYSTNGHFLNVSGYDYTDKNNCKVRLTDPNIQRVIPSSNGEYWVTLEEFYQATITSKSKEFVCT